MVNPTAWEREARGLLRIWGQPGVHSEFQVSQSNSIVSSFFKTHTHRNNQTIKSHKVFLHKCTNTCNFHVRLHSMYGCIHIDLRPLLAISRDLLPLASVWALPAWGAAPCAHYRGHFNARTPGVWTSRISEPFYKAVRKDTILIPYLHCIRMFIFVLIVDVVHLKVISWIFCKFR